jgi:hypothetical protein
MAGADTIAAMAHGRKKGDQIRQVRQHSLCARPVPEQEVFSQLRQVENLVEAQFMRGQIYLTGARHADGYREGRKKYLPHTPPSTLIMGVQLAKPEMLREIDAIAVIPANRQSLDLRRRQKVMRAILRQI